MYELAAEKLGIQKFEAKNFNDGNLDVENFNDGDFSNKNFDGENFNGEHNSGSGIFNGEHHTGFETCFKSLDEACFDGLERACLVGLDEVGRGPLAGPLCVAAVILPNSPQIVGLDDSKKVTPKRRELLAKEIEAQATSIGLSFVEPSFIDSCGMSKAIKMAFSQALDSCMSKLNEGAGKAGDTGGLAKASAISATANVAGAASVATSAASAAAGKASGTSIAINAANAAAEQANVAAKDTDRINPDVVFVDGNPLHIHENEVNVLKGDAKIACISAASIYAKVKRDALMETYAKQYPEYGFDKHKGYGTAAHIEAIKKFGPCLIHRRSFLSNILSQKE